MLSGAKNTQKFDFIEKSRHKRYYAILAINVFYIERQKYVAFNITQYCCANPALSTEINFHDFDLYIDIKEFRGQRDLSRAL